jgi:hypothetical protein
LESGPNISRLRAHPEGLEMLSLAARCATVEVEVIAEVSLRYSGPTMQAVQDSWMGLVTRREVGVWVFVAVFGDPFHAYKKFIRWGVSTVY